MENQFIPFELAVKLKELGFDEECFSFYNQNGKLNQSRIDSFNWVIKNSSYNVNKLGYIAAPLWQQAFNWFRENHGLLGFVENGNIMNNIRFHVHINSIEKSEVGSNVVREVNLFDIISYEEARHACLEKLIELATKNDI